MDRLDELSILVAVVDGGSLAAAARRLRRSAPAVTRGLAALEERVGARLIERTTRRMAPTAGGRQLAAEARTLLAAYATAVSVTQEKTLRGTVRVTAPLVFGRRHVSPVVVSFLKRHPDVRVDLVLADRNLDLVEEGLDVAVRIGALADSGLVARRVGEVRRVLVAAPDYLARRGTPRRPSDITGHDTIHASARPGPIEWRFREGARSRVVRLDPRLTANEVEGGLVAVRAGCGLMSALSYQVADDLAAGVLVRLLPDFEPPPLPVSLVSQGGRYAPARTRTFLHHASNALGTLPVIRPERGSDDGEI